MTFTPLMPEADRLDGALSQAEEILARARADAKAAGPGARGFGRFTIYPPTPEAVDALAARWGTRAEWRAGNSQYVTRTGDCLGELEAVWFRDTAATQAGNEAAA